MNSYPFEIYSARIQLNASNDLRPCLVISLSNDPIDVLAISSQSDLCQDQRIHFPLDPAHPNFHATGLKRKSFVIGIRELKVARADIKHRLGRLEGKLLAEFK